MVLAIPTYTLFRIVAQEFLQEFPWIKPDRHGRTGACGCVRPL